MTVGVISTFQNTRTGTGDPYTSSVTIDPACKGLLMFLAHGQSSTDHTTGLTATIGGVTMRRLATAADTAGEPGRVYAWFAQTMPASGSQSISVDLDTTTGDDMALWVVQLSSDVGRLIIPTALGAFLTADQANPSITVDSGPNVGKRFMLTYSGLSGAASLTPAANMTNLAFYDFSSQGWTARLDAEIGMSSGATPMTLTAALDDVAALAFAVAEVPGPFAELMLAKGAVGYWPMNESVGTWAQDWSGWCCNGTYNGYVMFHQTPLFACPELGSVIFNGGIPQAAPISWMITPDHNNFSVATTTKLTVLAICELGGQSIHDGRTIMGKATSGNYEWNFTNYVGVPNAGPTIDNFDGAGGGVAQVAASGVTPGVGILVATCDTVAPKLEEFWNTTSLGTDVTFTSSTPNGTAGITFGKRGDDLGPFFLRIGPGAVFPVVLNSTDLSDIQTAVNAVPASTALPPSITRGRSMVTTQRFVD